MIVAAPADRSQVLGFARWCLNEPYGFVTIISVALSLITGCKFNFGFDGQCKLVIVSDPFRGSLLLTMKRRQVDVA